MLRKPLTPIPDDTEEAPWMVMGMPQSDAAVRFYTSLRGELESRQQPLLVAMFLPIGYRPIPSGRVEQLAPDVLVAPVPDRPRTSYDVAREGVPPVFVLEIVSPESQTRDREIKPGRYERMGVQEYALFAPRMPDGAFLFHPPLQGYRRDPVTDRFERWEPDEEGRLDSAVLDLWLVLRDDELRLQRRDGSLVPTIEEEREARRQLEEEVARLRAEVESR